jgi:hypothetical protein
MLGRMTGDARLEYGISGLCVHCQGIEFGTGGSETKQ